MMEKLTFDKVPETIQMILQKLENIEQILTIKKEQEDKFNEIMDVTEAGTFLKLTRSTIYTKVCRGEIPAFKSGKKLFFKKQELLDHLQLHRKMTNYELQKEAALRIRHFPRTRKYSY